VELAVSRREKPIPELPAPKYAQLAHQLEDTIRNGAWPDGRIPPVREIAQNNGVSAFTVSRALQLLREKGILQTRERSGSFLVDSVQSKERWAVVLRVSPTSWAGASAAVVQSGLERVALAESVEFVPLRFDANASGEAEARRLVHAILSSKLGGVFFLPSRLNEELQRQDEAFLRWCRKESIPVVLLDRNLRGAERPLEYDLVGSDHFEGGRCCTRHLLSLGRQRIACVVASPVNTHLERTAGYLLALAETERTRGTTYPSLVVQVPLEPGGREAYAWLADQLADFAADGVICYQDYTAVGLIVELLRRGIRVPQDVAVVGCDDLPIGNTFSLGVTTYAYPSEAIVRRALSVMRDRIRYPDEPPVRVMLPGRLIVRQSTQPG
jgi:LacI family transcriptional regulator